MVKYKKHHKFRVRYQVVEKSAKEQLLILFLNQTEQLILRLVQKLIGQIPRFHLMIKQNLIKHYYRPLQERK
jgi:hypothetical protein